MTLAEATEVFVRGYSFTKSLTSPYVPTLQGNLWVMRDGPGRRQPPRTAEFVACDLPPAEVIRQIGSPEFRYGLAVLRSTEEDLDTVRRAYRSEGFRLLRREPMFVRNCEDLGADLGSVRLVSTKDDFEAVFRASRRREIDPAHLDRPELVRLYGAFSGRFAIGWVKSVPVGKAGWVSNLFVDPGHRGRGIGFALMAALLAGDAAHGLSESVLLASNLGARLYSRLGYRQIGVLLLFAPTTARP